MKTFKFFSALLVLSFALLAGTGTSETVSPVSPLDSLSLLEAEVDNAIFKEHHKQAVYDALFRQSPKTMTEKINHIKKIKSARYDLFIARAETSRAKQRWCYYYASVINIDNEARKARLSAYKHKTLAGKWEQRAASFRESANVNIAYGKHKHKLDMSKYGD